jgi:NADPH:quinone reductase
MWNLPVVANHRKTGEVGTMKAIRFDHHGEPVKVLAIEERLVPEPVDGVVRVRILAGPVNPSDLLYVRGHYAGVQAQLLGPVGFEGVGIVDAPGPQVQGCLDSA